LGACDGFDVNKDGYPGILPWLKWSRSEDDYLYTPKKRNHKDVKLS
jgi:hypothetical protein